MERLAHAFPSAFNALASRAFRKIDVNENKVIESGELYVGVLLGYDKLNKVLSKLGMYLDVPGELHSASPGSSLSRPTPNPNPNLCP